MNEERARAFERLAKKHMQEYMDECGLKDIEEARLAAGILNVIVADMAETVIHGEHSTVQ